MTKFATILLACFITIAFVGSPLEALARTRDKPNSGFCKSGKHVANIKNCKENGGRK